MALPADQNNPDTLEEALPPPVGAPVNTEYEPPTSPPMGAPIAVALPQLVKPSTQKPLYLQWWLWVIIAVFAISCVAMITNTVSNVMQPAPEAVTASAALTAPTAPDTPTSQDSSTLEMPEVQPDKVQSELQVVFLDVGQADAALVSLGNHHMLIDGGNSADSSLIYAVLQKHGITNLEYIINSHPDDDHVGGLSGALRAATVDTVYSSVDSHTTKGFNKFKDGLAAKNLAITIPASGTTIDFGEAELTFIHPDRDFKDVNEDSLVVRLVYGETSFLFTGDIGSPAEAALVESGVPIESDVLKVPHHGSKYSSSYLFLKTVNPKYAVISVGAKNQYGHPTEEALSKYRDQGARLFRTDLQGDITFISDGKTLSVVTAKGANADVFAANNSYEEAAPLTPAPEPEANPDSTVAPPASTPSDGDATVYVTNTGAKYHKDGCRYLSSSKTPISRAEALAQGYEPCKVCSPG